MEVNARQPFFLTRGFAEGGGAGARFVKVIDQRLSGSRRRASCPIGLERRPWVVTRTTGLQAMAPDSVSSPSRGATLKAARQSQEDFDGLSPNASLRAGARH